MLDPVGAELARDSGPKTAIAGKPCSYNVRGLQTAIAGKPCSYKRRGPRQAVLRAAINEAP